MSNHLKSALAAGVIMATAASAVTAAEEEKGFYIGGNAFYTDVFDADGKLSTPGAGSPLDAIPVLGPILGGLLGGGGAAASANIETSFDEDFGYGLVFGYKYASPWRGELEYRMGENDIDSFDTAVGDFDGGGTLETESLMANFWYDFSQGERLRPYVGFGVGMANYELGDADDDVVIGQLGAGVNFHLSPRLVLDAGYRYAMADDPELKYDNAKLETEYEAQSLMLGLRYNFFDAQYGVQDEDGDGVIDENDQCPGTPAGVQVDSTGCPLDGDNDGVADYLDQCPNTPAGVEVNAEGCALDSDGDGVIDVNDVCPDTPAGTPVMSNGCGEQQSVVLRGVNFELDSAQLTTNAETILDGVTETLNTSPGFDVEIQGHTDSTGSASYNMNLSQNRAQSVKNYLVQGGVDSSRLTARGYGEDMPVASNDTRSGRAENRRVELKVVGGSDVMVDDEPMMDEPMMDDEPMMEDDAMGEEPAMDDMSDDSAAEEEYEYSYEPLSDDSMDDAAMDDDMSEEAESNDAAADEVDDSEYNLDYDF